MKLNQPTFTDFIDKQVYFKQILKHIDTINCENKFKTNQKDLFYLWATENENSDFNIRAISSKDPVKDILFSSSSDVNPAIARIFDQVLFDCSKKFGGSGPYAKKLINNLIQESAHNETNAFNFDKVVTWLRILFEEVIPRELAPYAVPNTLKTFSDTASILYEQYDHDLVTNVIKSVIEAGSGGNIIVRQSPYHELFSIKKNVDGYQFKTFDRSKMFVGLNKFQTNPAISFHNPRLLLINGSLDEVSEIEEILEESARASQPLVIFASKISDEVYDVLKLNFEKGHLECFAAQMTNDYLSLNTIADIGVISDTMPITPFTMYSEFLMAKWDALPTVQEVIFFKDGTITIKNPGTEIQVRNQVKAIAEKRQQLSVEDFNIKEPNLTARIHNLTTSPICLYIPYKTESEGETKRIQVDTIIRYLKTIITYGTLDLKEFNSNDVHDKLEKAIPEKDKVFYAQHKWFFQKLIGSLDKDITPYLYIIGTYRLVAQRIAQIIGVGGMIVSLTD